MLLVEAFIVGIVIVIIGLIVSKFTSPILGVKLPDECESFNDKYVMECTLFLTGFLGHLFFEAIGANKWYCNNGVACKKLI